VLIHLILKTVLQTDGVKIKKIVYDIYLVEKLSKILFFQVKLPIPLGGILLLLNIALVRAGYFDVVLRIIKILLGLVIAVVLLFIIFLFYVLMKEKRYSWITMFFIMVVLPCILIILMFYDFVLLSAWLVVPFILFLFYCFLLKYSVANWLKDYYTHEEYEEQKIESAKRKQDELRWDP
jgi:fatty acid desaturase